MEIQAVGVIGAGVMGAGVAQTLAQSGLEAILIDVSQNNLDHAREQIHNNVRFHGFFKKGETKQSASEILGRVTLSTDYELLRRADFIIENVPEKWPIKVDVYKQMDAICQSHCVFAANTSALSITRIAAVT